MAHDERERTFRPMIVVGLALVGINMYWFGYEFFSECGFVWPPFNEVLGRMATSGIFENQYTLKAAALVSLFMGSISRRGKYSHEEWSQIIVYSTISACVFFFPYFHPLLYLLTTGIGSVLVTIAVGKIGNKIGGMHNPTASPYETFEQGTDTPIITDHSVNFRIKYMVNGKWKKGWLNVVNPFRGNMIFGGPGSGKSYSIVLEYIWQLISKGFTAFVYDFKKLELSTFTYNCYLRSKDIFKKKYGVEPYFAFVYMVDPRYSMRCNPLNRKYINDMSAASQKAKIITHNRIDPQKWNDYFTINAEILWTASIWALRKIENGRYCTLPHLIELCLSPQDKWMKLLSKFDDCKSYVRGIIQADTKGADDQAQGIFSTATSALTEMKTERSYWIFGANEVDLRINQKEHPTIFVVGNDPQNKDAFSTGIAMITSELYLQVNDKGRAPCLIAQDEFPTMKPEGFNVIIETGRSAGLVGLAAAQDMDQIIRDLKKDNANALLSIISNQFFGRTMGGHKKDISEMFGQHKVRQESETTGNERDTLQTSFHLEKRLPEDKIATLHTGRFAAVIADGIGKDKLDSMLFCAKLIIDENNRPNEKDGKWQEMPMFASERFEQEATRKKIEAEPDRYCVEYLYKEMMEEEQDKISNNSHANIRNEYMVRIDAEKKYGEMSDRKKHKLLKQVIAKNQEERAMEIMREFMRQIEDDILKIFNDFGITDNPMDQAGEKPQVGTPLNGGEKPEVGSSEELGDMDDNFFRTTEKGDAA